MLKHTSLWFLFVTLGLLASLISPRPFHHLHVQHPTWHNHHPYQNYHFHIKHHYEPNYPLRIFIVLMAFIFLYHIRRYIMARRRLSQGSVVVFSGSCVSRIGKELILTFAKNHSCDIMLYNNSLNSVQGLLEEIRNQKPKVTFFERLLKHLRKVEESPYLLVEQERKCAFYQVDFQNKDTIRMALAQTMADFGRIDIFIHIAEESDKNDFETYTPEEISAATQTHFLGPAYMIKEVLAIMQEQSKGQITYIPMQIGDFVDSSIFAYEGGKSDLSLVFQRLRAGLRKSKSAIKVTVANSDLIVGRDKKEVSMKEIRDSVKKIYQGILNQKEEIRKIERR